MILRIIMHNGPYPGGTMLGMAIVEQDDRTPIETATDVVETYAPLSIQNDDLSVTIAEQPKGVPGLRHYMHRLIPADQVAKVCANLDAAHKARLN